MSKEFIVNIAPNTEAEVVFSSTGAATDPKAWSVQDDILERASDTFTGAMAMIRQIGESAGEQLASLKGESIEVKVGLNLNAKGKFVVAEASAMASIEVKFTIKSKAGAAIGQADG